MTAPIMILQKTPTWAKIVLAMFFGAVIMFGVSCFRERERKVQDSLKIKSDSLVIVVAEKDSAWKIANAKVDTVIKDRNVYTDRVLAGNRESIPRSEVVELANRCLEVENSCKKQQAAATALVNSLKASLEVEKKRVALMPPRLKLAVEGGYGLDGSLPFRGRGELRLFGPISLVGTAGVRIPLDSVSVKKEIDVLVNYNFR